MEEPPGSASGGPVHRNPDGLLEPIWKWRKWCDPYAKIDDFLWNFRAAQEDIIAAP